MRLDGSGTSWDWKKIGGWIVSGLIAVASVAAIAIVATGIVASGGLLGAVLVGAGAGALVSMSASIVAQGGFANTDPWSVAIAGGIGAAIGAVSGAASFLGGAIGSQLGQSAGFALSNTPHLGTGIVFGKIFGTKLMMTAGFVLGRTVAGLMAAAFANQQANLLTDRYLNFDETIKEGIISEVPLWLITFFSWLFI